MATLRVFYIIFIVVYQRFNLTKALLLERALKNLPFHKSEPFSDKNKALLVQF